LLSFHAFALPVLHKFRMMRIWPFAFLLDIIYQTLYMLITGTYTALKKKVKGWS